MTPDRAPAETMRPVVFLHIPKTAGQTIHNALVAAVGGPAHVSPIRTHTQADTSDQFPPGFRLYSGHLDWVALESVSPNPFVFTVLRDPRERIASFYFYLEAEARGLSPAALARPENAGKRRLLEVSADDYFFGGDPAWQGFVRDHYENFYCTYFATRRMRGSREVAGQPPAAVIEAALRGIGLIDQVHFTDDLARLETALAAVVRRPLSISGSFHNTGKLARSEARWPHLLARLEKDANRTALEQFAARDEEFVARCRATV